MARQRELTRKIYFYRAEVLPDATGERPLFDWTVAQQTIDNLTFSQPDSGRYLPMQDGRALIVIPHGLNATSHRFSLAVVRRSDLPRLESAGSISPLQITPQQGLIEETHFAVFPNGLIGAEFNFYGPRITALEDYLRKKCPDMPKLHLQMLVQHNMAEQLQRMREIRAIRLRIRQGYEDLLQYASRNLPNAFEAGQGLLESPVLEVTWKVEKGARRGLPSAFTDFVRNLIGAEPRVREGADMFRVQAVDTATARLVEFDLLQDRLIATTRVIAADAAHRGVDARHMFEAIEQARQNLAEDLNRAWYTNGSR